MFDKICWTAIIVLTIVNVVYTYKNVKAESDFKIETFKDKPIQVYEVKTCEEEPSIKEYVLSEVKKAGLDPDYVERLVNCENRQWDEKRESWTGDRGIFQINRKWHPGVSDECAFDYKCNTKEAIRIRLEWGNWNAWVCSRLIE